MTISILCLGLFLGYGLLRIASAIETHACATAIGIERETTTASLRLAVDNTKGIQE